MPLIRVGFISLGEMPCAPLRSHPARLIFTYYPRKVLGIPCQWSITFHNLPFIVLISNWSWMIHLWFLFNSLEQTRLGSGVSLPFGADFKKMSQGTTVPLFLAASLGKTNERSNQACKLTNSLCRLPQWFFFPAKFPVEVKRAKIYQIFFLNETFQVFDFHKTFGLSRWRMEPRTRAKSGRE